MNNRILFVDDDPNILASFQRSFRKTFEFDTAAGGQEALACLEKNGTYAVIVCDMRMPGMDGIEVLETFRLRTPDTVRLMLTGNADQQTAVEAVNRGQIFRFINKPCPPEDLAPVITAAIEQFKHLQIERDILENTLTATVNVLAEILGMVAPDALGRGQRLRDSAQKFARFLGLTRTWEIELGALLSPIGYASLPPILLRKIFLGEIDFTPAETGILRRVPRIGHELLAAIPRLQPVADIVLYQNQHFDGTGYPADGCAGEAIPLGARILKIVSDRIILEADGIVKRKALDTMQHRKGVYDSALLEKNFLCFPDFLSNALSASQPVLSLFVADLTAGQTVVADIRSQGGSTLLSAGSRLTDTILQRLRNYSSLGDVKEPVLIQNPAG
jgi:response regulator RpfG family c-di-GMP phosphodiesterase